MKNVFHDEALWYLFLENGFGSNPTLPNQNVRFEIKMGLKSK